MNSPAEDVSSGISELCRRLSRHQPSLAQSRASVATLFFINGTLFSTWVSRIPAIQSQHALSHGALGMVLLAASLGAITAMPFTGLLTVRYGSRTVCLFAAMSYAIATPFLAMAPGTGTLAIALLLFGAAHGCLDVAMNAQAAEVENLYGEPIMSSFHAWFSLGGLAGALIGGILARAHWPPAEHFLSIALVLGVAPIALWPMLYAERPILNIKPRSDFTIHLTDSTYLALGGIAFCAMIGEGAIADWSALFLRDVRHASEAISAVGYAAFSIAMTTGRVSGDLLVSRIGPVRMVQYGASTVVAGLALAVVFSSAWVALIGFAGIGFGFATIVPLTFSAAGQMSNAGSGTAIASVATKGYLGFLVGPPLIGFISQFVNLSFALGILIVTTCIILKLSSAVGPLRGPRGSASK